MRQCDRCFMWAISERVEIEGSHCRRKDHEITHMEIAIARMKTCIDTLKQVTECEEYGIFETTYESDLSHMRCLRVFSDPLL